MSPRPPAAPRSSRPPAPRPADAGPQRQGAHPAARPLREASRVSLTSAQRFARRVVQRRRRRLLGLLAAVAVVAGLAWLVLGSPWLRTRTVEVDGAVRLDPALVQRAAAADVGRPLLLADTGRLTSVVGKQVVVDDVRVERAWPSTLRVVVTERVPVAAVPTGGQVALVDADGVTVERTAKAPEDLPVIEIDLLDERAAPALRAGLAVVEAMPQDLRDQVRTIGADTPDAVWLVLADRARVLWGSAEESDLKADVLRSLLPQKARQYDVSAPLAPAIRARG